MSRERALQRIVSCAADGELCVCSLHSMKCVWLVKALNTSIRALTVLSPPSSSSLDSDSMDIERNTLCVTGATDCLLKLWALPSTMDDSTSSSLSANPLD